MATTDPAAQGTAAGPETPAEGPARAGLVLAALITGALVCNINLSVANIALPDIGKAFDTSQTMVNLVAVGTTLGLAMSVLYFGAVADRYGRKQMLSIGLFLTVPVSLLATFAPSIGVLIVARIATGLAAGMAYPTTLALVTALWPRGSARTKAIALWSGVSGAAAVVGPVISGWLLSYFWWGSVFLVAVPPAIVGFVLVRAVVPSHVNESSESVDHVGGVMSVVMIAALIIGLSFVGSAAQRSIALAGFAIAVVVGAGFVWRQSRAVNPLYDLSVARRRLFWVAAVAGIILGGSLVGSMFIGQQFLQNVLEYSTLDAGLAVLPAALGMMLSAPLSARLVLRLGSRSTMMVAYACLFFGFLDMLVLWRVGTAYWAVGLAYLAVGLGAGLGLTPASRSVTGSTPVRRVGMASGTADLQRDLGGAVMQAIFGSLLAAGYAREFTSLLGSASSAQSQQVSQSTQDALLASYSSAAQVAERYPQYANQIITAARESFLSGANWAYAAALAAALAGFLLVRFAFPGHEEEEALVAQYATEDAAAEPGI